MSLLACGSALSCFQIENVLADNANVSVISTGQRQFATVSKKDRQGEEDLRPQSRPVKKKKKSWRTAHPDGAVTSLPPLAVITPAEFRPQLHPYSVFFCFALLFFFKRDRRRETGS